MWVFYSAESRDDFLVWVALSGYNRNALEVEAAVSVLQLGIIKKYGLQTVCQTLDWAMGDKVKDSPLGCAAQRVSSLYGGTL